MVSISATGEHSQDAQKGRPARPQQCTLRAAGQTARIEGAHSDRAHSASENHQATRSTFFSILLVRLLGTVKADNKLG